MSFTFKVQRSIHDGGTKYYQTILVMNSRTRRSVVVTHWGAYSPGADLSPRFHGQTKMLVLDRGGVSEWDQAKKNKMKRGYSTWSGVADDVGMSDGEIRTIVNGFFHDRDAKKILDHISADAVWSSADDDESIPEPATKGLKEPVAPKAHHAEWGTW